MITKDQIQRYESTYDAIELPNGWTARVKVGHDDDAEPPWEREDGHGPVREALTLGEEVKHPGERLLSGGLHGRNERTWLYDFAEAVKIARRDGWECPHGFNNVLPECRVTKKMMAQCAAELDFQRLRAWCNDEWEYVCVSVELRDAEGEIVEGDSLCGVESDGEYWKELAAEMINGLAEGLVLPAMAADGTDGGTRS